MPHPAAAQPGRRGAGRRAPDAPLARALPGRAVVVPAGRRAVRANDTDYPFRAASAFTWLTGETVEDAVLRPGRPR